MEETFLYVKHYNGSDDNFTGIDNGERWLSIFQGIYQHQSTNGNIIYPVVKFLGNVNITRRRYYKGAKHPRKIIRQEIDTIYLNNNEEYKLINILFIELGYSDILLNEIINLVIINAYNPNIKIYNQNIADIQNNGIITF